MLVIITGQNCLLKVSPLPLFILVIHSSWQLIFSYFVELLDSLLAIGSSEKSMGQSKSTKYNETKINFQSVSEKNVDSPSNIYILLQSIEKNQNPYLDKSLLQKAFP
jgi:hypothetical protein